MPAPASLGNPVSLGARLRPLVPAPVLAWALALGLASCGDDSPTRQEPDPLEPPGELLLNGDVESGDSAPDAWKNSSPDPGEFVFEWASEDAGGGSRSLAIRSAHGGPVTALGYWGQSIPVTNPNGAMYELTAWIKTDEMAGPGVAIAVRGDDTSLENGAGEAFATTQGLRIIGGTRSWRRITVGLTGIPVDVDRITVYLMVMPGTSGTVHFDNLTLSPLDQTSATARNYLSRALDIMEANSIRRYEIDWPSFRTQAGQDAAGAQETTDTYYAIRRALQRIGDNHSFLRRPPPVASAPASPSWPQVPASPAPPPLPGPPLAQAEPRARLLEDRFGYVAVPAYGGGDRGEIDQLATDYHRLIEGVDALGSCGWVVDLRGNRGGNMWPMVAGVGPVLGEGAVGQFVDPDDVVSSWFYRGGSSGIDEAALATARDPYLVNPTPPVAVLTDSLTASSGEATAIAFRGRPNARSFGTPTRGLSTANRGFPLDDGAILYLTVSTMADRLGRLYGAELEPDVVVEGAPTGDPESDAPLRAALDWLSEHPACS